MRGALTIKEFAVAKGLEKLRPQLEPKLIDLKLIAPSDELTDEPADESGLLVCKETDQCTVPGCD